MKDLAKVGLFGFMAMVILILAVTTLCYRHGCQTRDKVIAGLESDLNTKGDIYDRGAAQARHADRILREASQNVKDKAQMVWDLVK